MRNKIHFLLAAFLLILVTSEALRAQLGKSSWTIETDFKSFERPNEIRYFNLFLADSISFGSKVYDILYECWSFDGDSCDGRYPYGYVRTSGDSVFFKYKYEDEGPDTSEFLLYDYSLEVGDTAHLRFDIPSWPEQEHIFCRFEVSAIDSVNTVSGKKKRQQLRMLDNCAFPPPNGDLYGTCYGNKLNWIEGVGSEISFFYPRHGVDCMGLGETWHHRLTCYHRGDSLLYMPYGLCEPLSAGEYSFLEDFSVFPNPAADHLRIELPAQYVAEQVKLIIHDLNGRKLLQRSFTEPNLRLSTESLADGLYFITIRSEDRLLDVRKVEVRH